MQSFVLSLLLFTTFDKVNAEDLIEVVPENSCWALRWTRPLASTYTQVASDTKSPYVNKTLSDLVADGLIKKSAVGKVERKSDLLYPVFTVPFSRSVTENYFSLSVTCKCKNYPTTSGLMRHPATKKVLTKAPVSCRGAVPPGGFFKYNLEEQTAGTCYVTSRWSLMPSQNTPYFLSAKSERGQKSQLAVQVHSGRFIRKQEILYFEEGSFSLDGLSASDVCDHDDLVKSRSVQRSGIAFPSWHDLLPSVEMAPTA